MNVDRKITAAIRDTMIGNEPPEDLQVFEMLLDIVDSQQSEIDHLNSEHLRQEQRIADLGRSVARLSGVHGA